MCFIHIMASSFKGAAHTQLIKVSPKFVQFSSSHMNF